MSKCELWLELELKLELRSAQSWRLHAQAHAPVPPVTNSAVNDMSCTIDVAAIPCCRQLNHSERPSFQAGVYLSIGQRVARITHAIGRRPLTKKRNSQATVVRGAACE